MLDNTKAARHKAIRNTKDVPIPIVATQGRVGRMDGWMDGCFFYGTLTHWVILVPSYGKTFTGGQEL